MPIFFREAEWNPFRELDDLQRRMDRLFRERFGVERVPWRAGVYPPVNISEDHNHYFVRAEIPGVTPQDLEIEVKDRHLVIRGERKVHQTATEVNYHRREREHGIFRRVVTLPGPVNPDKVEAACKDGILTIRLAKPEEVKPRQIKVQSA